jgi:hypothetical protein
MKPLKPLKLNRTTVRNLNSDELSNVDGGTVLTRPTLIQTIIRCATVVCPPTLTRTSQIDACGSALACPTTIFDPGRGGGF